MKKLAIIPIILLAFCVAAWAGSGSELIKSDTGVLVYGPLYNYASVGDAAWGTTPNYAVATWVHPEWPWKTDTDGAIWISTAYLLEGPPYSISSWRWFHDEFTIPCSAYNIDSSVTLNVDADNAEDVYFNGAYVGSDGEVQDPYQENYEWTTIIPYTINPKAGLNYLEFIVRNYPGMDYQSRNPTGLIYKGVVNYQIPDVVWQPPVTNADFILKDGTTLPLKFKLYTQEGSLITEMKDVYLIVACGGMVITETWVIGEGSNFLRYDPYEYYYIANFKTRNYEATNWTGCVAEVRDGCSETPLGEIPFEFSSAHGASRGNSGK